jgi:hypothetical protein
MVVKLSDQMTAPLRQRSQILRGKVAGSESPIWFSPGFAASTKSGDATPTRTKKGLDVEKR